MKQATIVALAVVFLVVLSALAFSQMDTIANSIATKVETTTTFISAKMDLEESKTCTTEFYDEITPVYGSCTYYNNFTSCLNTSGANTDCSAQQATS